MQLSIAKSDLPFEKQSCMGFAKFVAERLAMEIITTTDEAELIRWDALFLLMQNDKGEIDLSQIRFVDKTTLKSIKEGTTGVTLSLIIDACESLVCDDKDDFITVGINPSTLAKNFSQSIKLATVCKMINYGTVDVKGYPIFTQCFAEAKENLGVYVNKYNWGLPLV